MTWSIAYRMPTNQSAPLIPGELANCRFKKKISAYLNSLASAGQRDSRQLTICSLAYLTEQNEGRNPRFTGC